MVVDDRLVFCGCCFFGCVFMFVLIAFDRGGGVSVVVDLLRAGGRCLLGCIRLSLIMMLLFVVVYVVLVVAVVVVVVFVVVIAPVFFCNRGVIR